MVMSNKHIVGREFTFTARSRVGVKREVLAYWYKNRSQLDLSLKDFLSRCRLSSDERTVVFSQRLTSGLVR